MSVMYTIVTRIFLEFFFIYPVSFLLIFLYRKFNHLENFFYFLLRFCNVSAFGVISGILILLLSFVTEPQNFFSTFCFTFSRYYISTNVCSSILDSRHQCTGYCPRRPFQHTSPEPRHENPDGEIPSLLPSLPISLSSGHHTDADSRIV